MSTPSSLSESNALLVALVLVSFTAGIALVFHYAGVITVRDIDALEAIALAPLAIAGVLRLL